jgi:uncharacterized alpha-E superfamily protein
MLSRVAENLYWIGRYIERAENNARLLDVNYYATLESGGLVAEQWAPLLKITGSEESFEQFEAAQQAAETANAQAVPRWIAFEPRNFSSIRSCIAQARENARALRDRISSEMWECLNMAYHRLCFGTEHVLPNDALHDYCVAARDVSHLFFGIAEATLPRDLGWYFLGAGRELERADNVLRLLQVRYRRTSNDAVIHEAFENHRWMAVLKSASAYEAYRKEYQTRLEPSQIAEFLLLNTSFPRSVHACAEALHAHLKAIAKETSVGGRGDILRESGRLAAKLRYSTLADIIKPEDGDRDQDDDEETGIDELLSGLGRIGAMIYKTHFSMG